MGELHKTLSMELKKLITQRHYKLVKDADGNDVAVETQCPAQLLNVARQFLKDNKIESLPNVGKKGEFLEPDDLPTFDDEPGNVLAFSKP